MSYHLDDVAKSFIRWFQCLMEQNISRIFIVLMLQFRLNVESYLWKAYNIIPSFYCFTF